MPDGFSRPVEQTLSTQTPTPQQTPSPTEERIARLRADFAATAKYPLRQNKELTPAQLAAARAEAGILIAISPARPLPVLVDADALVPSSESNRATREMAYLAQEAARRRPLAEIRATPEHVAEVAARYVDIAPPEQIADAEAVFLDGATPEEIARARAAFEARHG